MVHYGLWKKLTPCALVIHNNYFFHAGADMTEFGSFWTACRGRLFSECMTFNVPSVWYPAGPSPIDRDAE